MTTSAKSHQFEVKVEEHGSISISVEVLAPESYADLVKRRSPGTKFHPAVGDKRAIDVSYKDLLILTKFKGEGLGPLAQAVDARLDGMLQSAIDQSGFQGKQGETVLLNLESAALGSGNARKILVVGLGKRELYGQFVWCGLVSTIMSEAAELSAEHILLGLNDLPEGDEWLTASQLASVLRCRVRQYLSKEVERGRLKKIRLIVSREKQEDVESGLAELEPLCIVCSNPYL